jgi:hypothetical protein
VKDSLGFTADLANRVCKHNLHVSHLELIEEKWELGFLSAWRVFIDLQIFLTFGIYCNRVKKLISHIGSFVLDLIIEKLFNESFLAVVGSIVEDLVNDDQEDLNVLAVIGTVIEDLVDDNQEDTNKWFECNEGNVITSIALTFGDKKFNQEDAIETGDKDTLMI